MGFSEIKKSGERNCELQFNYQKIKMKGKTLEQKPLPSGGRTDKNKRENSVRKILVVVFVLILGFSGGVSAHTADQIHLTLTGPEHCHCEDVVWGKKYCMPYPKSDNWVENGEKIMYKFSYETTPNYLTLETPATHDAIQIIYDPEYFEYVSYWAELDGIADEFFCVLGNAATNEDLTNFRTGLTAASLTFGVHSCATGAGCVLPATWMLLEYGAFETMESTRCFEVHEITKDVNGKDVGILTFFYKEHADGDTGAVYIQLRAKKCGETGIQGFYKHTYHDHIFDFSVHNTEKSYPHITTKISGEGCNCTGSDNKCFVTIPNFTIYNYPGTVICTDIPSEASEFGCWKYTQEDDYTCHTTCAPDGSYSPTSEACCSGLNYDTDANQCISNCPEVCKCKNSTTIGSQNSDCTWTDETNCPNGCDVGGTEQCFPDETTTSNCSETTGWKCKDENTRGYRDSDCNWSGIATCNHGCNYTTGTCNPTPSGTCTPEWYCDAFDQRRYKLSDCSVWTTPACHYGCENGFCKPENPPTNPICTPNSLECVDSDTIKKCYLDGSGWKYYECPGGCENQLCHACLAEGLMACGDQYGIGDKNKNRYKCKMKFGSITGGPTRSWVYTGLWECYYGCTNGECNICEVGRTKCNGNNLETCNGLGWDVTHCNIACSTSGTDHCMICTPGAQYCSGNISYECDYDGSEWEPDDCNNGCSVGGCIKCTPGERHCDAVNLKICNGHGTSYETINCPNGCSNNYCNLCVPSSKTCNGFMSEDCNANGTWLNTTFCSWGCSLGECKPEPPKCPDGTYSGYCNWTTREYCDNGTLVNNCTMCGCANISQICHQGQCVIPVACENVICGENAYCVMGECYCSGGYKNCNGNWSDGCEAECCGSETRTCDTGGCNGTQTCNSTGGWGECVKEDMCCGVTCGTGYNCSRGNCGVILGCNTEITTTNPGGNNVTLAADLNCGGDGLEIEAGGITLDCNGHTISGSGSGTGIYIDEVNNVVIKNCIIRNFREGIILDSGNSNKIINNTVYNNRESGILFHSSSTCNNIISGNNIYGNGNEASDWEGGIVLNTPSNTNNNLIINNQIHDNLPSGIYMDIDDGGNNKIINNTIYHNFYKDEDCDLYGGITINDHDIVAEITGNYIFDNQCSGIWAEDLDHGTLNANIIYGNKYGIFHIFPDDIVVNSNIICENDVADVVGNDNKNYNFFHNNYCDGIVDENNYNKFRNCAHICSSKPACDYLFCGENANCSNSTCVCDSGWKNCDNSYGTGCEAHCCGNETQNCTASNGCGGNQTCADGEWSECNTTLNYCDTNCDGIKDVCQLNSCSPCECVNGQTRSCIAQNGCIGSQNCTSGAWENCTTTLNYCDTNCDGVNDTCQSGECQTCECIGEGPKTCMVGGCSGAKNCTNGILGSFLKNDLCCGVDCSDGDSCTHDVCSAGVCSNPAVTECTHNDGCCVNGCSPVDDNDCPCANDSCCDDSNFCTIDSCSTGVCSGTLISQCFDGDGCCPAGCTKENDNDCGCMNDLDCASSQFCNESDLCQNLTCNEFHKPFNHQCFHNCDLNYDNIHFHDYNDLMTTYKCFLGINNCDNYYQNWNLIKQEYQCFINSDN
ncbi:hypothetical protein BEH94_09625 [Candidatus Altiarchaeales archaeon WOR_SM1_SCG]|nr:hypothetical protein BEH94_09625 [Candidatus Altiarchaeales archaeon WOR_SM1_SCG]